MKELLKSKKGKIVITVVVLMLMVGISFGFIEYNKYQESIKSKVVFKDITEIGMSEDLMILVESYEADDIRVNRIYDSQGALVEVVSIGTYKVIFTATSNNHETEFPKEITFLDDQGPVINGISDREVEYGAEVNLVEGIEAIDKVDGIVEITVSEFNTKFVGNQTIEYSAKDKVGNETKETSILTVKEPACAENATWNGENCVCSSGYTGDGWAACKVVSNKKTTTANSNNSINKGTSTSGSNNEKINSNTSNSSGGLSWDLEVPSQESLDKVYQEGNGKYGEGNSWGANIDSSGNVTDWWQ